MSFGLGFLLDISERVTTLISFPQAGYRGVETPRLPVAVGSIDQHQRLSLVLLCHIDVGLKLPQTAVPREALNGP
jgi:hypothetical protein